jgi:CPA2 family monovalent cation:H+ antiporter-2
MAASEKPLAIIVGYGPVGRLVDALLRDGGLQTVVIDMNIETVQDLLKAGRTAIYGDATRRDVLEQAGIRRAVHLVISLPHADARVPLVLLARELNPTVAITVRTRYIADRAVLAKAGASKVVFEEGEAGVALARHVLEQRGLEPARVEALLAAVRKLWHLGD